MGKECLPYKKFKIGHCTRKFHTSENLLLTHERNLIDFANVTRILNIYVRLPIRRREVETFLNSQ